MNKSSKLISMSMITAGLLFAAVTVAIPQASADSNDEQLVGKFFKKCDKAQTSGTEQDKENAQEKGDKAAEQFEHHAEKSDPNAEAFCTVGD